MRISLMLALFAISSLTLANETTPFSTSNSDKIRAVKNTAKRLFQKEIGTVVQTPIKGLYEVVVGTEDIFYISEEGRYVVVGNIYEASMPPRNLTDEKRTELREAQNPMRIKAINTMGEEEMVVFAPKGNTKHTINVFTDVDCPYCVKFHNEVAALNKAGIKVHYLAFPRAGVDSETYKKMVSVWCASDRQQAMTDAKVRRKVESITCKNPIKDQLHLGQKIGVTGTPAMVLSNGELVPGYVPAEKLIPLLDQKFPPSQ